ncbi:MAG: PIN domain-containing protein [Bacteroidia bacterium]
MTEKVFLDTNFLIYCFSSDEPDKQKKCLDILIKEKAKKSFVLSTQVLNEFAAVMIKKYQVSALAVKEIIQDFSEFETVKIDIPQISDAIDIHILNQLSFWDSLIISAAKSANCTTIYTEDLQHNQKIGNVRISNPFIS